MDDNRWCQQQQLTTTDILHVKLSLLKRKKYYNYLRSGCETVHQSST